MIRLTLEDYSGFSMAKGLKVRMEVGKNSWGHQGEPQEREWEPELVCRQWRREKVGSTGFADGWGVEGILTLCGLFG